MMTVAAMVLAQDRPALLSPNIGVVKHRQYPAVITTRFMLDVVAMDQSSPEC